MFIFIMRIIYILFRDFFIISGLCLFFLLIVEDIQPGFVYFWFDINNILVVVIISGVLTLITSRFSSQEPKNMVE